MTIVATIPSRSYAPQQLTLTPNVSKKIGDRKIRITFTRENWPEGDVATIEVIYPDGTSGGVVGFSGGTSPRGTTSAMEITSPDDTGAPAGKYTILIVIFQTITTAVTIERL